MVHLRGGKPERCAREWAILEADGSIGRDTGGPPYSPLRLDIPAWMVGEDKITDVHERYEDKRLQTASRPTKMNDKYASSTAAS